MDIDKISEKLKKELKELVLWRLDTEGPSHFKLSVGNMGTFTKDELKKHVDDWDEIGALFVEMQLDFMKATARGEVSEILLR